MWWLVGLGAALVLYALSKTQTGSALAVSAVGAVEDFLTPRGIRNNNPGNIVRSSIAWQGSATVADLASMNLSYDQTFEQFVAPNWGVRAIGHVLLSKAGRGLVTVDAIIRDYSKTDQDAYVANVADALGVDPNAPLDVAANLPAFATAIIQQEEGEQPYADADIAQWVYS